MRAWEGKSETNKNTVNMILGIKEEKEADDQPWRDQIEGKDINGGGPVDWSAHCS